MCLRLGHARKFNPRFDGRHGAKTGELDDQIIVVLEASWGEHCCVYRNCRDRDRQGISDLCTVGPRCPVPHKQSCRQQTLLRSHDQRLGTHYRSVNFQIPVLFRWPRPRKRSKPSTRKPSRGLIGTISLFIVWLLYSLLQHSGEPPT
jgi:hypothetical protein